MADEHPSRAPRIVHGSLAVAAVGLAFAIGLVVLGIAYEAWDASLAVRAIGFAALVAWTATTLAFAHRAWKLTVRGRSSGALSSEAESPREPSDGKEAARRTDLVRRIEKAAAPSMLGLALVLTLSLAGIILFAGDDESDPALAVLGLSPAGQVAIAEQCGGALSPQLAAEIDATSLDEPTLRITPVSSCREAEEVVIPQSDIASISLLDDAAPGQGPQIGRARIDWSVPARLQPNGPESQATPNPNAWPVVLEVSDPEHASCEGATYKWFISRSDSDGRLRLVRSEVRQGPNCSYSVKLPAEDAYRVDLVVTSADGRLATGSAEVIVQDWLIVALGDSVASGEGHPAKQAPHWRGLEPRCHQSAAAWPWRAALTIENADKRTSVTLIHLACTGARIRRTDEHVPGQVLLAEASAATPPTFQFGQAETLLQPPRREIDAVVVSVGANDIRFSEVVIRCLLKRHCNERYDAEMPRRFADLEHSYMSLADAFRSSPALRDAPVYLTEYFDPIHDEEGNPCRIGVRFLSPAQITPAEAEWAYLQVLRPLNALGRAAAENHGWTYVGGIADAFAAHGYCARDSWVVGILEAARRTPGFFGVLNLKKAIASMRQFPFHPRIKGHVAYTERVVEVLRGDFYNSDGEPRRPRLSTSG
jgi:hypothetical protein